MQTIFRHARPGLPRHHGQQAAQLSDHVRDCVGRGVAAGAGGLGEGFRVRPAPATGDLWQRRGDDVERHDSGAGQPAYGMRPYQLTLGDEAAMRALPEVRAATGYLNRNDLYQVSA